MLALNIEGTKDTPCIIFSPENMELSISGYSYPENPLEFYKPFLKIVNEALSSEKDNFTVLMKLVYFNSSTSKIFIDVFDQLEEAAKKGKKIEIKWIFIVGNDSIQEYGEDFKEGLEYVNFNIIEIPS
jgi:hypothetical protein